MKNLKVILSLTLLTFFLSSCSKESVDKQSSDKMNEKKEALSTEKISNKEVTNKVSDNIKLFKVDKVEKSAGKKVAPDIFWTDNGKQTSMGSLKGNVVLVNMWATWCGPCIKEMPDLSKISEELSDKNFKMIGLNVFQQEGSKKVEDFLKTNPVSYTILDANKEVVDAFSEADGKNIEAVPTTFIVDKNGKIAETIIGGRSKEAFLKIINKYLN